jgi:predicted small lipoprotein YifL
MRQTCDALCSVPRLLAALALVAALAGCAAKRPVLYPNAHYEAVGNEVAEVDIEECMVLAEQHVGREAAGTKVASDTAVGGGSGAAIGAAGGAVRGTAGRGAATGAAMGATAGLLRGVFRSREPDPIFRGYVDTCLAERGYHTIGWR